jgi:hypothetical protein
LRRRGGALAERRETIADGDQGDQRNQHRRAKSQVRQPTPPRAAAPERHPPTRRDRRDRRDRDRTATRCGPTATLARIGRRGDAPVTPAGPIGERRRELAGIGEARARFFRQRPHRDRRQRRGIAALRRFGERGGSCTCFSAMPTVLSR